MLPKQRLLLIQALAKLEQRWSNLRQGPSAISEADAHRLAASVYDRCITAHKDNPSEQQAWPGNVPMAAVWDDRSWHPRRVHDDRADALRQQCFETADELLVAAGLITDETGRQRLARAVSATMHRANVALKKLAAGATRYVSLDKLFSDWALERNPAPRPTRSEAFSVSLELR